MRYALSATAAGLLISSAALAGPDLIGFPEGYQDRFTHYATVNRADERKQVVKIFANDVALASAKDGAPLDSGSVLVMEIYLAKLDADDNPVVGNDGFFEPGDMAGIASRLPYLAGLGIDALWLTPFYPSPQADHGYDVADYRDVDPRFGTLADFDAMLARARLRLRRVSVRAMLVRGDIRSLPFRSRRPFALVMAPYGILQSLTRERDLHATLASAHRVLARGGLFGIDLVPDLPRWSEYRGRVSLEGRAKGGRTLTLVESVRQDRRRRLTIFDQTYIERRGREERRHRFSLTFRTLSVPQMARRLERAGFTVEAVLGDYQGGPWDERADTWVVLARRRS